MGRFNEAIHGTPLAGSSLVDAKQERLLFAIGVTTVEDLLGQARVVPEAMHEFLDIDLAQVQADAATSETALLTVQSAEQEFSGRRFALGAEAPLGAPIEEVAQESTLLAMLGGIEAGEEKREERVDVLGCFGPVRDQGDRGTCVGHAGSAVIECLHHARFGEHVNLSPQFLFYNAKMNDGHPDVDGTWLSAAMPTLETDGICREQEWPYEPDKRSDDVHHGPPPSSAATEALLHRSSETEDLDARDIDAIKRVVDEGRPVAVSVPVYQNWWGVTTTLTGKIPMPLPYSRLEGGHAMCIAGYDFDEDFPGGGFFILRNSWGETWARQSPIAAGYGAMAFEYIGRYGWEVFSARLA